MIISHEPLSNGQFRFTMILDRPQIFAAKEILWWAKHGGETTMQKHVRRIMKGGFNVALDEPTPGCCPFDLMEDAELTVTLSWGEEDPGSVAQEPDEPPPKKLMCRVVKWSEKKQGHFVCAILNEPDDLLLVLSPARLQGASVEFPWDGLIREIRFGFLPDTGHVVRPDMVGDDLIEAAKQPIREYGDDLDKFATEES